MNYPAPAEGDFPLARVKKHISPYNGMEFIEELRFLKEQLFFKERLRKKSGFSNIVIAGMGGSGVAGQIFREMYSDVPVHLVDDYSIPRFVSRDTLFIGISYSGNTEETVSAVREATKKKAHVVTISSGGKLKGLGAQHIAIPNASLQPRSATGYMLMPLLNTFGLVKKKELQSAYWLLSELDKDNDECKAHAQAIMTGEKIPCIFGSTPFSSIAYRWKTQFNENAKVLAYSNSFPELNHNDTMALAQTYSKDKFYFMVFASERERIKRRISVTAEIASAQFNESFLKPLHHAILSLSFCISDTSSGATLRSLPRWYET